MTVSVGFGPTGIARSCLLLATLVCAVAGPTRSAFGQDLAAVGRRLTAIEGDAQTLTRQPLRSDPVRSPTFVEERLTDGELFFRLQDYVRASIIFTDIVEHHAAHRAYPDALFLLGDSLFRAGDYLGARRRFEMILSRASEPAFRPYVQRSLGRLIEVAIHTRSFDGVDEHFDRLSQLPPTEVEAATTYFRGKYLYNRALPNSDQGELPDATSVDTYALDQAQRMFSAVPEGSPYDLQARYFVGVVHTVKGQYPQAVEAFRRVLSAPTNGANDEQVVELAQLALGRLHYQADQLAAAIEAYQAVPRTSSRFDQALFEIAWVFIRMGDSTRAERALEVLALSAPNSPFVPDGQLLRGNLLLRSGRHADSEEIFREVRSRFGPVRRELQDMVASHDDVRGFFRDLVRDNLDTFDAADFLPPLAQQWAVEDAEMERALSVLSDLSTTRRLVRETSSLVERLSAALQSRNAVNVFGDLRLQREKTVSLRNRLARVRTKLVQAETRATGAGSASLQEVRRERRQLETLIGGMPTDGEDFEVRNDQLLGRYRLLERQLNELHVELMGVEARVVATERFLKEAELPLGTDFSAVEAELVAQRAAAETYRENIEELRRAVEQAKLQVGVGDARYERDDRIREEYDRLVERERTLLAEQGIQRPRELDALFGRLAAVNSLLDQRDARIDSLVDQRRERMMQVVDEESANVVRYRQAMVGLEHEAEDVVGTVTYLNFDGVRQRFYDLVLRADVGRIDVSWAEREEHRMRVDMLTRARSREIQTLDDEFREIMDLGSSGGSE